MTATLFLCAATVAAADQAIKALAIRRLAPRITPGGARVPLAAAAILWIAAVAFLLLVPARYLTPSLAIALGLALGGATGNLCDRLARGGVVDFIAIGRWPAFNFADAALVAGAVLAVLSAL